MVRTWKKIVVSFVTLAVVLGGFPIGQSKAALVDYDATPIQYSVPGMKQSKFTASFAEAMEATYQAQKGHIIIHRSCEIDLPDFLPYGYLNEKTILDVERPATVTISQNNFRIEGLLQVRGVLDIQNSKGLLYGGGRVVEMDDGKIIHRSYDITKEGDYYLEGSEITYGQPLSESVIRKEGMKASTSINGTWEFVDPDCVPQAGTHAHTVVFRPEYPLSYETKEFERGGLVTTKKAVPKLTEYEKPQIHVGEKLLGISPQMKYVSPVTGEEIEGEFVFQQENEVIGEVGEQEFSGTFTPKDSNFSSVTQYMKVDVLETEPTIVELPMIRNQGIYGQRLQEIRFLTGRCINPYTGKVVKGSWEWNNPEERLCLGSKEYSMLFIPEEEGYKKQQISLSVTTLPKVMESVEWPTCTDIEYGQALSDSHLSCTKNQYGTFAWKNENIRPAVKNQGVAVVFTPANTEVYDWSKMAGYDEESKTVSFTIPIQVNSIQGELPQIQATPVQSGECLSKSLLSLQGMAGALGWKDSSEVAEQSGVYEALYTPADASNYDWSLYSPGEDGKIKMQVYVNVTPKPTPTATPVPKPSPSPVPTAEPTPEQSPTPSPSPTASPSPEPTAEPTPELSPTPSPSPTASPSPEPTAEPTPEQSPTPSPSPTASPSPVPTAEPTPEQSPTPSPSPTASPSPEPTAEPTPELSPTPSPSPTASPSPEPTAEPTPELSPTPSPSPTASPSPVATAEPTPELSPTPSPSPSPTPEATPTKNTSSTDVDGGGTYSVASTKALSSGIDSSYVITQMLPKVSTIQSPSRVKKTEISKVKRKGTSAKISWKKISGAKYIVQYSSSKKMKKAKKKSASKSSIKLSGLTRGKTYYVRVRTWKKKNGKNVYGKWSKLKKM